MARHFFGRECVVHQPGGDGATRHTVKLGGSIVLRDDHSALGFYGADAQRSIAAGSREDNANGTVSPVQRQGAEEKVNGQVLSARGGEFQELERAVQDGHVAIRRDDVDAVRLHRHPVFHLENRHARVAADEIGEDTFVAGRQMLDEDKGHPRSRFRRHTGEERLERRQSAGRRADANYGKRRIERRRRFSIETGLIHN